MAGEEPKTKSIGVVDAVASYHKARSHDKIDMMLWRISLVTKVLIIMAVIASIPTQEFFLIFSGIIALFFMFLPAILQRKWKVFLPVEIDIFLSIFILVHFVLGEVHNYYRLPWFDLALHMSSAAVVALLGFLIIYVFLSTKKITARPSMILLFAISLSMCIGATWEIFEFSMDQLFGFNMQKSGLVDTMWDLIVTLIAAILVSLAGYRYLKSEQKGGVIHRLAQKFHKHYVPK